MKLYVLFMQRKEDSCGESPPEPIVTWDEYNKDMNPEGFIKDVLDAKRAHSQDAAGFALVPLVIDGARIRDMCLDLDRAVEARIET